MRIQMCVDDNVAMGTVWHAAVGCLDEGKMVLSFI
jgi:hypothetical protein